MDAWNPMEGSGTAVDMMSGRPWPAEEKHTPTDRAERLRLQREQAVLVLLQQLGQGQGTEVFRRLLQGLFDSLHTFLVVPAAQAETLAELSMMRARVALLVETIGDARAVDQVVRHALAELLARILYTDVPRIREAEGNTDG